MKRFVLYTLVVGACLAAQPTGAQSCSVQARNACISDFAGGWLSRPLVDYCRLALTLLCEVGY